MTYIRLICPSCGGSNIDQYHTYTGPIWCKDCGLRAPDKQKYSPFVKPELPEEVDVSHIQTFTGYAQYLTALEEELRAAVSKALGILYVPYQKHSIVEVGVDLLECTTLDAYLFRSFICQNANIKVAVDF